MAKPNYSFQKRQRDLAKKKKKEEKKARKAAASGAATSEDAESGTNEEGADEAEPATGQEDAEAK